MTRLTSTFAALGALLFSSSHSRGALHGQPVHVPAHAAPVIDGRLSSGEWAEAARYELSNGTELWFQHDDRYLYVALRGQRTMLGSLCVSHGDSVRVLHASMALGTAIYRRGDSAWSLLQPFAYTMRETDTTATTRAKRAAFLAEHGWIANTIPVGEQAIREYQIALSLLDPLRLDIAALYPQDERMHVTAWPAADDCASMELVSGNTPRQLRFQPARWAPLVLMSD
jgi:hypothetical protein